MRMMRTVISAGLVLPNSPLEGEAVIRKTAAATSFKELVDACVAAARRQSTDGISWEGLNPPDVLVSGETGDAKEKAPVVPVLRGA